MPRFTPCIRLCLILVFLGALAVAPLQAQIPTVVLEDVPADVLIGEVFHFKLFFKADPGLVGYGPFVELYVQYQGADCTTPLPSGAAGPCDGLEFVQATAHFANGDVPLAPIPAGCAFVLAPSCSPGPPCSNCAAPGGFFGFPTAPPLPGFQKVVLELPFGSFVPGQPAVEIDMAVRVHKSADVGFPLQVQARGGFRFGGQASGTTPTIGPLASAETVTPHVFTVRKLYLGPENETATGPNFPRQYRIEVDVADGQSLDNLEVEDCLPDNLTFLGLDLSNTTPPPLSPNTPPPCFKVSFGSVTGGAGGPEVVETFNFFVPELDASGHQVLDSSCRAASPDEVTVSGDWEPEDPRDKPAITDVVTETHTLTDKCLALQKSVTLATDTGASGFTPGDILKYTLEFQISDFRTIRNLVVDDYLSDGQTLLLSDPIHPPPALDVSDPFGGPVTGTFTGAFLDDQTVVPTSPCAAGEPAANPRQIRFLVSGLLASLDPSGRHGTGILTGGRASLPAGGPAKGSITFYAVIDDQYKRQAGTLEAFVDKGDPLLNCAIAKADVLANVNAPAIPGTVLGSTTDSSAIGLTMVVDSLDKSVYAINGNTSFPAPKVSPGDQITFRIQYPLPSTDAENLRLEDFSPIPVLPVSPSFSLVSSCALAIPPPDQAIAVGSLCNDFPAPSFLASGPGAPNSLTFDYGDLNDPNNIGRTVDLLYTLTVSNAPFADGLQLTNEVHEQESNTFGEVLGQQAIAQITLCEPKLRVRKGVVSTNKATAVLSPAPSAPAGVTFAPPNTVGPPFSGTINSSNVESALRSDLFGADGCDLVKFAVVIENLGCSSKGAFDVQIRDLLPACVGSRFNVQVRNGKGMPITCNGGKNCAGLFSSFFGTTGITLDDSSGAGALAPYSPIGGDNIAVITFDIGVGCTAPATGCCTNVAQLLNYAGVEGGPNHVPANLSKPFPGASGAFSDGADICVRPALSKSITGTSEPHTGKAGGTEQLAIGETVTYRLEVVVPEGTSPGMTITDTLPAALQWLPGSCSVTKNPSIITANPLKVVLNGAALSLNLADVLNFGDNPAPETVTIVCQALVLNDPANVKPAAKNNFFSVQLKPKGQPGVAYTSNTVPAVIVEPMGAVTKEELPSASLGTATYVLGFTNTGTAAAFDVTLVDNLPAPLTVQGAVTPSAGCSVAPTPSNQVRVTCAMVPAGASVKVQFNATGVPLCKALPNTARLDYSSLPGPNAAERAYSSTASVTTTRCPDLTVTKSHLGDFHQGQSGTYTLTVKNTGNAPSVAPDVVKDSLPAGLFFLSGGGNGWTCASTNGQDVTCTNGTPIPPGGSSSFTITAIVTCGLSTIENCADVSTATEINLANNRSCDPAKVTKADPCEIAAVAAGGTHSLALRSDGTVLSWGARGKGPFDTTVPSSPVPARVGGLTGIFRIAGGGAHSLALRQGGTVWAWGNNDYGQLGDGTHTTSRIPVQVTGLTNVVAIAAGGYHSLALKGDGTLWAWGRNDYGQLGNGSTVNADVPVQIGGLTGIKAFAAGLDHSMVVRSDGTVLAWGKNDFGQLGNGSTAVFSTSHVQVRGPGGAGFLTGIVGIAGGYNHSLAIRSDGTVWAWGSNELGKLGNGTAADSRVPVQVKTPAGGVFVEVAAGRHHSIALRKDRTVWTWGGNTFGQLGIGGLSSSSSVPLVVSGVFDTTAIAAGGVHSLALEIFGTGVHAWGFNASGQLGNGTTATSKVPVKVPIESLCPACGCPACGTCGP